MIKDAVFDYTLESDSNILVTSYSENTEGVVDGVKICGENDQYISMLQDKESVDLVGVFQNVYVKKEDMKVI